MPTPFFLQWPDGSEALVETFTEKTALDTAYNGTERATILRGKPRYGLSARFVQFNPGEDNELEDLRQGKEVYVPGWMHPTKLTPNVAWPSSLGALAGGYLNWPDPIPNQVTPLYWTEPGSVYNSIVVPSVARTTPGAAPVAGLWHYHGNTYGEGLYLPIDHAAQDAIPAAATVVYPAIKCRLEEAGLTQTSLNGRVSHLNLAFESDDFDPAIPAGDVSMYGYSVVDGFGTLGVLGEPHNWVASVPRETSFSENKFDEGMLAARRIRHIKHGVTLQLDCFSRAEALKLRRFLLSMRGRAGRFAWKDLDGVTRAFRLSSDTWSMAWRGPDYAQVKLRIVRLS